MSDECLCPICREKLKSYRVDTQGGVFFECARCGAYHLGDRAIAIWNSKFRDDSKARAKLSHSISKMTRGPGDWPRIPDDLLLQILADPIELLPVTEQLDNLILWLGNNQADAGTWVMDFTRAIGAIGAVDVNGLGFVASQAQALGLVDGKPVASRSMDGITTFNFIPMQLTIQGWQRLEELRRGKTRSRIAFMAMPFGEDDLNSLFRDMLVPAVDKTGFKLKRLDDEQPAGLIDDRMRVEIRQSRFLISDLTHRNPGAYWEAGYAEGLGKPVIYTCRKDVFDRTDSRPHFDTNHHLTVVWDPSNLNVATEKLKNTIRATLPDEAKLED